MVKPAAPIIFIKSPKANGNSPIINKVQIEGNEPLMEYRNMLRPISPGIYIIAKFAVSMSPSIGVKLRALKYLSLISPRKSAASIKPIK